MDEIYKQIPRFKSLSQAQRSFTEKIVLYLTTRMWLPMLGFCNPSRLPVAKRIVLYRLPVPRQSGRFLTPSPLKGECLQLI